MGKIRRLIGLINPGTLIICSFVSIAILIFFNYPISQVPLPFYFRHPVLIYTTKIIIVLLLLFSCLACGFFSIWWGFFRGANRGARTIFSLALFAIAGCLFLYAGASLMGTLFWKKYALSLQKEPFNTDVWIGAVQSCSVSHYAYPMLPDLFEKYNLKKMDRESVIKLLGPPSKATPDSLSYCVGWPSDHLAVITPYDLAIEFDKKGKVARYFLIRE